MLTKPLFLCGFALTLIPPGLSQTGFWGLPICQQSCIFSMLDKHVALGCATADVACLCSESNFVYGVRDCILQSCPPEWDNYGNAYLQVCATTQVPQFTTIWSTNTLPLGPSWLSSGVLVLPTLSSAIMTAQVVTADITSTILVTIYETLAGYSTPVPPSWTSTVIVTETVSPLPVA